MDMMNIPEGYNRVMPYLIIKGAAEFLEFTKAVFGAEEKMKHMREDSAVIMHGEVRIGDSVIMFAESTDPARTDVAGLFVYVPDADKAYEAAISRGATPVMPMGNQPYGRTGGVLDPFGNTWWITTPV